MDQPSVQLSHRIQGVAGSAIRALFKHSARPDVISFAGGNPGSFALPDQQMASLAQQLLKDQGKVLLQYGQTEGYAPLLDLLPGYIADALGAQISRENLLITTGSMQGLDLLLKVLTNPGDVVLTESPVFLGALQAMHLFQTKVVPVPCDEDGMDMEALERLMKQYKPKLLYTIPTFQNPTGRTLSLGRRQHVAHLAARYGVVVAEDDPYHQLRYDGSPLPVIKTFDMKGWVVLLGSFSKIISPGLRVGFMAGPPALLERCGVCKQCSDVHTANLNQALVAAFLQQGLLAPHVHSLCQRYGSRRDAMLDALAGVGGISHYTRPQGGLFVFAELAPGLEAEPLFHHALQQGVAFVPGEHFYAEGGHTNTLRLNFSNADEDTISRGIGILAQCLNGLQ
jgi:2-aminoadipate transaminase